MSRKKNNVGDEPSEIPQGREASGVQENEFEARHRSDCNRQIIYFWGTQSQGEECNKIYRCACGAQEEWTSVTTGEISEGKVA